jgi:site-specific recombinase XerD
MAACPSTPVGLRNRALIAVMYRAGLRIREALELRPKDIDPAAGAVRVLFAKGGKDRTVGIDPGGMAVLASWLAVRGERPLGSPPLCTARGRAVTRAVTTGYVRRLLPSLGRKAGIAKKGACPRAAAHARGPAPD